MDKLLEGFKETQKEIEKDAYEGEFRLWLRCDIETCNNKDKSVSLTELFKMFVDRYDHKFHKFNVSDIMNKYEFDPIKTLINLSYHKDETLLNNIGLLNIINGLIRQGFINTDSLGINEININIATNNNGIPNLFMFSPNKQNIKEDIYKKLSERSDKLRSENQ